MIQTLPISKAREDLASLVENAKSHLDEFVITVNGYPAAVLMSVAEYDSLKETNEILGNPQLMQAIKAGEEDVRLNRVYDWEKVKKELKIDVQSTTYSTSQKRVKKNL
ncbi:MAG: type II toxin-antitoxin system Phd/YefM family antitoxin [Patescibacteria group bacterium]